MLRRSRSAFFRLALAPLDIVLDRFVLILTIRSEALHGERLCELINAIQPGSVPRITRSAMPFRQMENIAAYLDACRTIGVPNFELFNIRSHAVHELAIPWDQVSGAVAYGIFYTAAVLGLAMVVFERRDLK